MEICAIFFFFPWPPLPKSFCSSLPSATHTRKLKPLDHKRTLLCIKVCFYNTMTSLPQTPLLLCVWGVSLFDGQGAGRNFCFSGLTFLSNDDEKRTMCVSLRCGVVWYGVWQWDEKVRGRCKGFVKGCESCEGCVCGAGGWRARK